MLLSDYFSVFVLNRWCRQINICAVELLIFFFFFFFLEGVGLIVSLEVFFFFNWPILMSDRY